MGILYLGLLYIFNRDVIHYSYIYVNIIYMSEYMKYINSPLVAHKTGRRPILISYDTFDIFTIYYNIISYDI